MFGMVPLTCLLLVLASGSCENGECIEGDPTGQSDPTILLQHIKKRHEKLTGAPTLALGGGGFKQNAVLAGLFPALMNALPSMSVAELFSAIDVITSASSGGWFLAMFAYSPSYLDMTQRMAKSPTSAGKIYWSEWIEPFLATMGIEGDVKVASEARKMLADDSSAIGKITQDFLDILLQWAFATQGSESKSWSDVVGVILAAGGLTGQETLGSPVNTWAKGKKWLIGTSLSTPGGKGPGACHDTQASGLFCVSPRDPEALVYGNTSQDTLSYSVLGAESVAAWTPAKFSVEMGGEKRQNVLAKACPSCDNMKLKLQYRLGDERLDSEVPSPTWHSHTPLRAAVTATSAFLGEVMVLPFFDAKYLKLLSDKLAELLGKLPLVGEEIQNSLASNLFQLLSIDWTEWSMTASDAAVAFKQGDQLVQELKDNNGKLSQKAFTNLVDRRFLGMVDAGLTDNSAIGHALSSGAEEVIFFYQTKADGSLKDLYRLLGGEKTDNQIIPVSELNFCPFCFANFQVFQQTQSDVEDKLKEVSKYFEIPSQASTLSGIQVATLNLTTVQCDYFGIEADRAVTLHLLVVQSPLLIGGFAYADFGTLVQEIMDAFRAPANEGLVNTILSWLKH